MTNMAKSQTMRTMIATITTGSRSCGLPVRLIPSSAISVAAIITHRPTFLTFFISTVLTSCLRCLADFYAKADLVFLYFNETAFDV